MSDKETPKVFAVPFVLRSEGTAYVLAESSDAAEKYLDTLSAEDLLALETTYSTEADTAEEEDGEDWDFDATKPNVDDVDDIDDVDDDEEGIEAEDDE